jgi:hypothetical protein
MRRLIAAFVLALAACSAQPSAPSAPARYGVDTQCQQDAAFVAAYQPLKTRSDAAIDGTRAQLVATHAGSGQAALLRTLADELGSFRSGLLGLPSTPDVADQVNALAVALQGFAADADALAANPAGDEGPFLAGAKSMSDSEHDLDLEVLFVKGQCT